MKNIMITVCFLLFIAGFAAAEEVENTKEEKSNFLERTGIIFNTDNILFDLEAYQGGVGFKYRGDSLFWRTMLDISFSSSTNKFIVGTGFTLEKHLRIGKISPYWGFFIHAAYESEKFETDSDNWSELIEYPISTGPLLGVEVFLMDYLSFFVEYNLSLLIVGVTKKESTLGVVTENTNWNYNISVGIGNSSKLGIVIYLDNVFKLEEDDKKE